MLQVEPVLVVYAVAMIDFMLSLEVCILKALSYVVIMHSHEYLFLVYIILTVTLKATLLHELAQHILSCFDVSVHPISVVPQLLQCKVGAG